MPVQMIMTHDQYTEMREKLFPPNNDREQFGFMITGISKFDNGCNLLCRKYIHADGSCLNEQSRISVVPKPEFVQFAYYGVKECKGGLVVFHTHPFSDERVCFSGIDDRSQAASFSKEVKYLGDGPHASVVLGRNSVDARWFNAKTGRTEPITAIKIIGERGTRVLTPTSKGKSGIDENEVSEIHNRQVLAFGKAGQRLIQKCKVAIVGCGGIGSLLFIALVRLGVRDLVLIDSDTVESTNLNRLAGSRLIDVENKTPKVEMLAQCARQINPHIKLTMIPDSVSSSEALHALKSCDHIFGGLDALSPRVLLNTDFRRAFCTNILSFSTDG